MLHVYFERDKINEMHVRRLLYNIYVVSALLKYYFYPW